MADPAFDLLLAIFILAALFAWIPFVPREDPGAASLLPGEIPNLIEEDASPRFTGTVA